MKTEKFKKPGLIIILSVLLSSCHPSANEYFGIAALNCNTFSHFGSGEIKQFLMEQPQTYDFNKKVMKASTYQEYFQFDCVDRSTENYNKVKDLPITNDTRRMITASLALYEFCLPRYQHEYLEIARMKDDNRSQSEIDVALKKFDDNYLREFLVKYNAAWDEGAIYAKANNIPLTTVNTQPVF